LTAAKKSNQIFIHEPNWHAYKRTPNISISLNMRGWLLDRGSLTQRLIKLSRGNFRVKVLKQNISTPALSETRALKIPLRQKALIRQVFLYCHNEPLVYARSVIPLGTLTGRLRYLQNLQNKALGALLFKDATMKRGIIDIGSTKINPHSRHKFVTTNDTEIWGRRSLFYIDKKPLLVSEQFMPALQNIIEHE